jgi:hypothetical protein
MIHRIQLTPDAELELEDSLNIVLVTPERRITVTNLVAWEQALGNFRVLRDVAATNRTFEVGDPDPTADLGEDGPFCAAMDQNGYGCTWLLGHGTSVPHVAGAHTADGPRIAAVWTGPTAAVLDEPS